MDEKKSVFENFMDIVYAGAWFMGTIAASYEAGKRGNKPLCVDAVKKRLKAQYTQERPKPGPIGFMG